MPNNYNSTYREGSTESKVATESQVLGLLERQLTIGYRPSIPAAVFWTADGLPDWYLYRDIEVMQTHPHVAMCMRQYKGGLAGTQIKVKASSSKVGEFVEKQWRKFWLDCRSKVQMSYEWGWMGAEVVYETKNGLLGLDEIEDFSPRDVTPLTRNGKYVGVRVKSTNVDLWGPDMGLWEEFPQQRQRLYIPRKTPSKGFWHAHHPRYGSLYGRSQYWASWRSWRRLSGQDGGEFVADAAVYRFGVAGPIMRYPQEDYRDSAGNMVDTRAKAREFVENAKAGVSIAMPSSKYSPEMGGDYKWSLEFPDHTINVSGILEYLKRLEDEIAYGIGVPPELLEAQESGSGYSGRAIPMEAFMENQQEDAEAIVRSWKKQIADPLVEWNFGPEAWFEVEVESLLKTKIQNSGQAQQGQQGAQGQQAGAAPQPGQPQQGQPQSGQDMLAQLLGGAGGEEEEKGKPKQFSLEAVGTQLYPLSDRHDYACAKFDLPCGLSERIKDFTDMFPPNLLGEEGVEDCYHVTIKYGLVDNCPDKLKQLLYGVGPITVTLGNLSLFQCAGKDDVLKIDVYGEGLFALNRLLASSLTNVEDHPVYKPHVTLGYFRPGAAQRYVGDSRFDGLKVTFDTLAFSPANGGPEEEIELCGTPVQFSLSESQKLRFGWTGYTNKKGHQVWRNTVTGEKRYQAHMPGTRGHAKKLTNHREVKEKGSSYLQMARRFPKEAIKKVGSVVVAKYRDLEAKFGRKGALSILTASVLLTPIPVPGTSLLPVLVASVAYRLHKSVKARMAKVQPVTLAIDPAELQANLEQYAHDFLEEIYKGLSADTAMWDVKLEDGQQFSVTRLATDAWTAYQGPEGGHGCSELSHSAGIGESVSEGSGEGKSTSRLSLSNPKKHPVLRLSNNRMERRILLGWVAYQGKRGKNAGQPGWKNTDSGRIVYQANAPKSRGQGAQTPASPTGKTAATGTPKLSGGKSTSPDTGVGVAGAGSTVKLPTAPKEPAVKAPRGTPATGKPAKTVPPSAIRIAGQAQKELANPNHPVNRLAEQIKTAKVGGGLPDVKTIKDSSGSKLTISDHQQMARLHGELSAALKDAGNVKASKSQGKMVKYHEQQAKEKTEHFGRLTSLSNTFKASLDRLTNVSREQREHYHKQATRVLRNLTPNALKRVQANTKGVSFYKDRVDLTDFFVKDYPSMAEIRSQGGTVNGIYDAGNQTLHLDGASTTYGDKLNPTGDDQTHHIYAHEMTHAIDGPKFEISHTDEWHKAWEKEIKASEEISKYAATNPQEGLAEFGRLVLASSHDAAKIRQDFPLCAAVWDKHGIL